MSSSTSNAESDEFNAVSLLFMLLGHKVRNIYPPTFPSGYTIISTFGLNRGIRKQIELINARDLVNSVRSDALKQAWAQLENLVKEWGYRGGRELPERIALRSTLRQLHAAIATLDDPLDDTLDDHLVAGDSLHAGDSLDAGDSLEEKEKDEGRDLKEEREEQGL